MHRFAARYAHTFGKAGHTPPIEALYLLAQGVHALACDRVRANHPVQDLEDILVGCATRLAGEETPWT